MVQAILGFFTSAIGVAVSIFMAAAGLTAFVILWKSGSLPVVLGWVGIVLRGIFIIGIPAGFNFLTALLGSVF